MATPTYAINGVSIDGGVDASWQQVPKRRRDDGSIDYQPMAIHTWDIARMTMATFLQLQALAGVAITSLDTNDVTDRNEAANYTDGEIVGIVNCTHVGTQAQNVKLEMRVLT